jgi:hypothetical protein
MASGTSQHHVFLKSGTKRAHQHFVVMAILNLASYEKTVHARVVCGNTGAANAPKMQENYAERAGTSNLLSSITLQGDVGTGNLQAGSTMTVYGLV